MKSDCYEIKICTYCVQRVAPDGVWGLKERLEDVKIRYNNKPLSVWSDEKKAEKLMECVLEIENQVMNYCKIKLEDIHDNSIKIYRRS